MRSRVWLVVLVCAGCTRLGTSPFEVIDAAPMPDATPIMPTLSSIASHVIVPICEECHIGVLPDGNMDLSAPDLRGTLLSVTKGPKCVPEAADAGVAPYVRVVPGDPDHSVLYTKLAAKAGLIAMPMCGEPMPKGAQRHALTQAQLDAIKQWILDGAQDN